MNKSWKNFEIIQTNVSPLQSKSIISKKRSSRKKLKYSKPPICLNEQNIHISDASSDSDSAITKKLSKNIYEEHIEDCSPAEISDIEDIDENISLHISDDISLLSSSEEECDISINCKRSKSKCEPLLFVKTKPSVVTDDIFNIVTCQEPKRSSTYTYHQNDNDANKIQSKKSPATSMWKDLSSSFKTKVKSPPKATKWPDLNKTFNFDEEIEIVSTALTPPDQQPKIIIESAESTSAAAVAATRLSFYDATKVTKIKYKKGCPVSKLQSILHQAASSRSFWGHDCENRLLVPQNVVKVNNIANVYGRIMISFTMNDDENHYIYLDPSDKLLKNLAVGSTLGIDFDIAGHMIEDYKIAHLGVWKINQLSK